VGDARYDRIGAEYAATRREDPRIAALIHGALGEAQTVVYARNATSGFARMPEAVVDRVVEAVGRDLRDGNVGYRLVVSNPC
jgi:hypothetical protein